MSLNYWLVINVWLIVCGQISNNSLFKFWSRAFKEGRIKDIHGFNAIYQDGEYIKAKSYANELDYIFKSSIIFSKIVRYLQTISIIMEDAVELYKKLMALGISVISSYDFNYPDSLISTDEPPLLLFIFNDDIIRSFDDIIAIVGTRKPSYEAVNITRSFANALADIGVTCISGNAMGIDRIVERSFVRRNAPFIAVLPHIDLERVNYYEKNIAYVSEYISGYCDNNLNGSMSWRLVKRNRIIAGLSRAVVVMEAPLMSGSLITAEYAWSYQRELFFLPTLRNKNNEGGIMYAIKFRRGDFVYDIEDIIVGVGMNEKLENLYRIIVRKICIVLNIDKDKENFMISLFLRYRNIGKVLIKFREGCRQLYEHDMIKLVQKGYVNIVKKKPVLYINQIFYD